MQLMQVVGAVAGARAALNLARLGQPDRGQHHAGRLKRHVDGLQWGGGRERNEGGSGMEASHAEPTPCSQHGRASRHWTPKLLLTAAAELFQWVLVLLLMRHSRMAPSARPVACQRGTGPPLQRESQSLGQVM